MYASMSYPEQDQMRGSELWKSCRDPQAPRKRVVFLWQDKLRTSEQSAPPMLIRGNPASPASPAMRGGPSGGPPAAAGPSTAAAAAAVAGGAEASALPPPESDADSEAAPAPVDQAGDGDWAAGASDEDADDEATLEEDEVRRPASPI